MGSLGAWLAPSGNVRFSGFKPVNPLENIKLENLDIWSASFCPSAAAAHEVVDRLRECDEEKLCGKLDDPLELPAEVRLLGDEERL